MSNEQSAEQGSNMVEALRFENRQLREANSELQTRAQQLAIEKRQLAIEKQAATDEKQAATDEVALLRSAQEANEKRFEQEMLRLTAAYEKELQTLKEQLTALQQLPSVETLRQKAPGPVEQHSSAVALVKALTELQRDSASLLTHLQEKVLGQARDIDVLIEENTKLNKQLDQPKAESKLYIQPPPTAEELLQKYREELTQQHKQLDEVREHYTRSRATCAEYELVLKEMAGGFVQTVIQTALSSTGVLVSCKLCTGDAAQRIEDIRHTSSCLTIKARNALYRMRKEAKS